MNPRTAAACVSRAANPSLAGFFLFFFFNSCWSARSRRALLVSWPRLAAGTCAVFFCAGLGGGSARLRRGAWLTRLSRSRGSRRSGPAPRPISLLPFPWISDLPCLAFLFLFVYFTFPLWRLVFSSSPSFRRPSPLFLLMSGFQLLFPDSFCAATTVLDPPGLSFLPPPHPPTQCREDLPSWKSRRPKDGA